MNKLLIYLLPLILVEVFLSNNNLIKCASTCTDTCQANYTHTGQCVRKAGEKLILECEQNDNNVVSFIRKNDNQYISGYNVQFYSDNNNYSQIDYKYNTLVINNVRRIDAGKNSFESYNIFDKAKICNFSVHLYGIFFIHT